MGFKNLEKRVKKFVIGTALTGTIIGYSGLSYADTIYYGKLEQEKKQNIAYVEWDEIKKASKYHKQLEKLNKNDPKYMIIQNKRNEEVMNTIKKIAKEKNYDVVIEKDDPKIEGYKNINKEIKKEICRIEE